MLVLAVLVAVAFVLVRRDLSLEGDASVSDQTKSRRFSVLSGRDRTQLPSTRKRY